VDLGQVWLTQIVTALAVATLGAVGGIFSGLIKTRDSSTTLDEYRTSMLKLGLRPLVGAVAAITAYLFLGWQITGVKVTNGGTFLLVGFLAGFSERYFLKLLRVPAEDSDKEAQRRDRLTSTRDQLVSIITGGSLPKEAQRRDRRTNIRDQLVSIISGGSLPSADVDQPSLFNSEPDGRTVSHGTSKRWLASIIHSR
jgi:hypothetical protein